MLRLIVTLQGERVIDLKPVMGYLHTGIEKSCEDKSYWKVIPFVERMDYLSYFFQMEAFCGCVERLVELEIPPRAKYLRVLHMELDRIMSHLVWLGTSALDLGAISMFWYCFRERDRILDLFEMSAGQRMHTRYFQVGGVFEDIPLGFEQKVREFCAEMPGRIDQYEALLDRNEIFLHRTRDVGIVSRERLLDLGVTGPLLRAAGEPWDLRKAEPYLSYGDFEFKIPVGTVGDGYDRYRVRVQEMRESVRIIEQCLDGLPEGPWIADDRKYVLPPRDELSTSMEALIHHFKLVTEGYRVPRERALLLDRKSSWRARLLRPGRWLVEAGPGPLPGPLVRQPAVPPRHVGRWAGRRPDPEPWNARPDHRGCRSVSPLLPKGKRPWTSDPGHIHDVPGPPWVRGPSEGEAEGATREMGQELVGVEIPAEEIEVIHATAEEREPHGEPAEVPEPSEVEVPRALAREIRRAIKRYPEKRSAAIPALWAVQRRYGWCTPEGINQAAAVMGVTPGYLQSVASFYDLFRLEPEGEHQVLVCTNISCWLRGADDLLAAFKEAAGNRVAKPDAPSPGTPVDARARDSASRDPREDVPVDVYVRSFECLGACDIAPMASIDERYYGPLTEEDAEAAVEQLRADRKEILPEKRLADRPAAGGQRASGDKRIARHPVNKGSRPAAKSKAKPKGKR